MIGPPGEVGNSRNEETKEDGPNQPEMKASAAAPNSRRQPEGPNDETGTQNCDWKGKASRLDVVGMKKIVRGPRKGNQHD